MLEEGEMPLLVRNALGFLEESEESRRLSNAMAKAMAGVKEDKASIKFKAYVHKVGTMGTGGLRVSLDLDQTYIKEMAMLAECQHGLIELEFEATASE